MPSHHRVPFPACQGDEPYAFVSYAHSDSDVVFREITLFHKMGYPIWYDEGINPGNEWPEEVAQALDLCTLFVVFISPKAVESRNVRNEINFALNNKKPFLAIHLRETKLPAGLELRMGDIQAVLKYATSDDRYRRLVERTLAGNLGSGQPRATIESSSEIKPPEDEDDEVDFGVL